MQRTLLGFLLLGVWVLTAQATTYFIDPQTGSDSNAGTSQGAPWQTLPGTRTVSNSGFKQAAWGSITTAAKVQPGDILELKAGSTMSSTQGGRLLIDAQYYSHGTAGSPITIRVSSTWGSGAFSYNGAGITVPAFNGLVAITQRDHVHVRGADATRRLRLLNAPGDWAMQVFGSSGTHQVGSQLAWLDLTDSAKGGLNISYANDWTVTDSLATDNGTVGFAVGGIADENSHSGSFTRCTASGNGALGAGSGIQHGFALYAGTNITYTHCIAHSNVRDGFDFGTSTNSNPHSATVLNSQSYDNGEDGYGTNGGSAANNVSTYINSVAFNNVQAGWHLYSGATAFVYHSVAHHNGDQTAFGGNFMIYSESPFATSATIRNSIGYKPKAYANVYSYTSGGLATTIDSDYNLWVPRASNTETFAETPFGTAFTYTAPPSWVGAHDQLGMSIDVAFMATSTSSFAANNYHLDSNCSTAHRAGVALPSVPEASLDIDGQARTAPVDIGLDEWSMAARAHPKRPGGR